MSDTTTLLAALDLATERMERLHPDRQIFIFGPEGDPFWARVRPNDGELTKLRVALDFLEKIESGRQRPFTASDEFGRFTVFALDVAGELYAVVLPTPRSIPSAEARDGHRTQGSVRSGPKWVRVALS